jgi:hypothetical protein
LIAIWNDEWLQADLENIFIPMSKNIAGEGHNCQINPLHINSRLLLKYFIQFAGNVGYVDSFSIAMLFNKQKLTVAINEH